MGLTKGSVFPSQYIKKEDLPQPRRVTIQDVRLETIRGDGGEEEKPVMFFCEAGVKPMVVNTTNWDACEYAYGPDTDGWLNKPVELYVDPGVLFAGKRVGGVRLRVPASSAQAADVLSFDQAVALADTVGIAKESLIAALKARGNKGYTAVRDTATVREMVAKAAQQEQGFPDADAAPTGDSIPF